MAKNDKARSEIIHVTMELAAKKGWHAFGLGDIAKKADISLKELRYLFSSRHEILAAFTRMIDDLVMDKVKPGKDESARERLFEVIMTRFEVMAPYKKALKRIYSDVKRHPELSASLTRAVLKSNYWMLNAAGIGTEGGRGALRVPGLTALYARALPVWLDDDDPGLAKTMATLDRRLGRAEKWISYLEDVCDKGNSFLCALIPPSCCGDKKSKNSGDAGTSTAQTDASEAAEAHVG